MKKRDIWYAIALFCSNGLIGGTVCGVDADPIIRTDSNTEKTTEGMIPLQKVKYKNNYNKVINANDFDFAYLFLSDLYDAMSQPNTRYERLYSIRNLIHRKLNHLRRDKFMSDEKERDEIINFCKNILTNYSDGTYLYDLYSKPRYLNELPEDLQNSIIQKLMSIVELLRIVNDPNKTDDAKETALLNLLFEPNEYTTPERIHLIMDNTKPENKEYLNWLPANTTWMEFVFDNIQKFLNLTDSFLKNKITLHELDDTFYQNDVFNSIFIRIRQSNFLYDEATCAACKNYQEQIDKARDIYKRNKDKKAYEERLIALNKNYTCNHAGNIENIKEAAEGPHKRFEQLLEESRQNIQNINLLEQTKIQTECTKIISNLLWSFDYTLRNDSNFHSKIGMCKDEKGGYGTGTLVTWDTLPEILKNQVVLSCAHLWVNYRVENLNKLDLECKATKAGIPNFISPRGDLIFYGEPKKYQFENFETREKLSIFNTNIEYCFVNIAQDLAIYILKEAPKYPKNSINISSVKLEKGQLDSPNFYHIGFCTEPLTEQDREYAARPYKLSFNCDKNEYLPHPKRSRPGNSGSPIIYRNPNNGELSIVGVITGYEIPYLDDAQMAWVQKAAQKYVIQKINRTGHL